MEHELYEIVKLSNELEKALRNLSKLDFSKTKFSKMAPDPLDYLNFLDVIFKTNRRLYDEFISDLRIERAIRERVPNRYYVVNSECKLNFDIMKLLPIKEFHNEWKAFEYMEKQNKLAQGLHKKNRIKKLKTYSIHKYNPETDLFTVLTDEEVNNIRKYILAAEAGVFT